MPCFKLKYIGMQEVVYDLIIAKSIPSHPCITLGVDVFLILDCWMPVNSKLGFHGLLVSFEATIDLNQVFKYRFPLFPLFQDDYPYFVAEPFSQPFTERFNMPNLVIVDPPHNCQMERPEDIIDISGGRSSAAQNLSDLSV